MLPIAFEWDAYVLPCSGRYLIDVPHDEKAFIVASVINTFEPWHMARWEKARSLRRIEDVPKYLDATGGVPPI